NWARQVFPVEPGQHRAGQPGRIDLDYVLMAEEFGEPAAEMPTRLHDDDARGGDVDAECLEEHRIGALEAVADDHHRESLDAQGRRGTGLQRVVRIDTAPSADRLLA